MAGEKDANDHVAELEAALSAPEAVRDAVRAHTLAEQESRELLVSETLSDPCLNVAFYSSSSKN